MKISICRKHRMGCFFGSLLLLFLVGWGLLNARTSEIPITKEQLDALMLENIKKIMVVAHPDDETFWGGAHLAEEKYLVVCLTSGNNMVRRREFEQAVQLTGSVPLILNYPDKELGIRSRWLGYQDDIKADLAVLFDYKEWEMAVTHNPDGEYGHIQHKMTSSLVTGVLSENLNTELFYFGNYYTPHELQEREGLNGLPDSVSEELYKMKQQMIIVYSSQEKVAKEFGHMLKYESWNKAEER